MLWWAYLFVSDNVLTEVFSKVKIILRDELNKNEEVIWRKNYLFSASSDAGSDKKQFKASSNLSKFPCKLCSEVFCKQALMRSYLQANSVARSEASSKRLKKQSCQVSGNMLWQVSFAHLMQRRLHALKCLR